MWESLPIWLKPGVTEYAKTGVIFDNGTKIIISATSPDAFRGESMNLLILDEFAFVPSNQAEEFWAANYPTISASKEAKIIIISTPNGMFNLFHRIYNQAKLKQNTFKHRRITWKRVPGRDKAWAEEQIKNLGEQQFNQEFNVAFLGSTNTVINPTVLKVLFTKIEEPNTYDMQDKLQLWEKPIEGCSYIIGADPSKGTGENFSVAQILKLVSVKPVRIEQVGIYRDNNTDVYMFAEILNRLSYYYNNAYIMCENNGEGNAVIQKLWWEYENENLVNTGSKSINLGIRATRTTKPRAILLMKKLIEDGSIKLVDKYTIEELSSFIEEKGKYFGKDRDDDCISALYWGIFLLEMGILEESYEFIKKDDSSDVWGLLTDIEHMVEDWSWLTDISLTDGF